MTPITDFKITPLFNADYLRNGTIEREGHGSYNYQFGITHAVLKRVISNDLTCRPATAAPRATYQTRHPLWSVWRRCLITGGIGRLSWRRSFSTYFTQSQPGFTLSSLLTVTRSQRNRTYLRHRRHDRVLPPKTGSLQINIFLIRPIYVDSY